MKIYGTVIALSLAALPLGAAWAVTPASTGTTIRTEQFPRPPYSGATYYIYERSGATICTKLQVCNKYEECSSSYFKGSYKAIEDKETGEPYGTSPPVTVSLAKVNKHVCLVRYKLTGV